MRCCALRGRCGPGRAVGVPGDLAAMPPPSSPVLPGTSHIGVTGRADMLMTMIPPFLDAP